MTDLPQGRPAEAPDRDPCWRGDWSVVGARTDVWAQAAVNRTVAALVELHPFRLGDRKATPRLLQWVAGRWAPARHPVLDEVPNGQALGVLTVAAREPDLDRSDTPAGGTSVDLVGDLVGGLVGAALSPAAQLLAGWADPRILRWGGALVRLTGTWLPPTAWLPRAARGLDDPRTAWPTESVDLARRFTMHSTDLRTAAALLTPAVMAILLDDVPPDCAVTISGDAVHLWWPYPPAAQAPGHAASVARAAERLTAAFPRFVLTEHPDVSGTLDADLAERADQARAYRAQRHLGRSPDPVLQRIYDRARAEQPPAD